MLQGSLRSPLAALGGLAAAAAHELGTPLATIQVVAKEMLRALIDKAVPKVLAVWNERCKKPVPYVEIGVVRSLCTLYDCCATKANGVDKADGEGYARMIELWFLFSLMWSIGATVDDDSSSGGSERPSGTATCSSPPHATSTNPESTTGANNVTRRRRMDPL